MSFDDAVEILKYCSNIGVTLSVCDDKLKVEAPLGILTSKIINFITIYKQDLIFIISHYGFTKEALQKAAGADWVDIENNEAAIKAFAYGLPNPKI